MTARPLIVFDVNETLPGLGTMEPAFQRIFGEKNAMRVRFANLILYSAALQSERRGIDHGDWPLR